ncbi:MAG TPA: hypothetical protein VGG75_39730 [Trebonia sp.]|jgi:cellulose 1,4-beta-cellobiosidase
MIRPKSEPLFAVAAALLLVSGGVAASVSGGASAQAATTSLCDSQTASVGSGSYIVQNNEYNSSKSECVTTNGSADLTVANSSIDNAPGGPPGAYPSIFQGCHWGDCSSGGLSSDPVKVSDLSSDAVTTSWSTAQPGGSSNAYDVAYDIWINRTRTTSGQPNGTEIMVWLNHDGDVQPFGSEVGKDVTIDGNEYDVWEGSQSSWDTVTYEMVKGTTSVSNLNVSDLAENSVSRGYTGSDWYLIDVEAGFELWQGGAGLATNSFSVTTTSSGGSGSGSGSPSTASGGRATASPSPGPVGQRRPATSGRSAR